MIDEVMRIAVEHVKVNGYSSMSEFTAEDIETIATDAQVEFTEVVDILGSELL